MPLEHLLLSQNPFQSAEVLIVQVNNAAIGLKKEAFSRASAQRLFDTNCRGALRVHRGLPRRFLPDFLSETSPRTLQ